VADEALVRYGVTIIGYTDLASRLAKQSSTLYATNLLRLTEELCKAKNGVAVVNMEDDAIRGLTVIQDGAITWPAPPLVVAPKPAPTATAAATPAADAKKKGGHGHGSSGPLPAKTLALLFAVVALAFWGIGAYAPAAFLGHFTVFVLACFIGYMVVWNVTPALHTPLMSVTNAISSIIALGALVQIAPPGTAGTGRPDELIRWLALAALVLTAINMFAGFAVTRRMLAMFRK
jgi:NAD(P) transhydrogenase subunit alpha